MHCIVARPKPGGFGPLKSLRIIRPRDAALRDPPAAASSTTGDPSGGIRDLQAAWPAGRLRLFAFGQSGHDRLRSGASTASVRGIDVRGHMASAEGLDECVMGRAWRGYPHRVPAFRPCLREGKPLLRAFVVRCIRSGEWARCVISVSAVPQALLQVEFPGLQRTCPEMRALRFAQVGRSAAQEWVALSGWAAFVRLGQSDRHHVKG